MFARNPKGQGNILVGMRHYYSREQALTGIATMEWIYEHFGEEGLFGLIFDSFYASWEALCFLEEKGIKFLASLKSSWYKSVHDLLSKVLVDMNDEVVAHMTVADLEKHTNHLAGRYEFAQGGVKFTVGDEDLSDLAKELNKGKQKKDAVAVLEDNRAKLIEKKEKLQASMDEPPKENLAPSIFSVSKTFSRPKIPFENIKNKEKQAERERKDFSHGREGRVSRGVLPLGHSSPAGRPSDSCLLRPRAAGRRCPDGRSGRDHAPRWD